MDWTSPLVIYEAVVITTGLLLIGRTFWVTGRVRLRNLRIMRGRLKLERAPVPTESPVDDANEKARQRAAVAIASQTTVARKTLVPTIVILTAAAALVPALPSVPASLVTATTAVFAVVLGIAARPTVENAIAGLVLTGSRIFNVGDTVRVDEHYGTVEDITATHTVVKLWDWRRHLIPNSEMIKRTALSYSLHDSFVWTSVEFHLEPGADLDEVERLAMSCMQQSEPLAAYEEPGFWVMGLEERSTRILLAGWADTPATSWLLGADTRKNIATALARAGIRTHGNQHHLDGEHRPAPPAA